MHWLVEQTHYPILCRRPPTTIPMHHTADTNPDIKARWPNVGTTNFAVGELLPRTYRLNPRHTRNLPLPRIDDIFCGGYSLRYQYIHQYITRLKIICHTTVNISSTKPFKDLFRTFYITWHLIWWWLLNWVIFLSLPFGEYYQTLKVYIFTLFTYRQLHFSNIHFISIIIWQHKFQ